MCIEAPTDGVVVLSGHSKRLLSNVVDTTKPECPVW